MRYLHLVLLAVLGLFVARFEAKAQNEFMLHGRLRADGDTVKGTRIIIKPFEERPETQKLEDNSGQFRIFLKYGKDYVITIQKEGYVKLIFKVSTKLPATIPQCCQTPLDISCHLFKPGGKHDSIFQKPFINIKYDTKLKGYNYGLDIDPYIKKLIERTEQERLAKIKEAERKKRIADSMVVEKHYLEHVTKGNLYFGNKQYVAARGEFEEAHKVIPARQYPIYKSEDCRTELERANRKSDSIAQINVDSIWKSQQKDTTKPKTVYRRMTADEVRAKMIRDVQNSMKRQGATDEAIKETFAYLDKAVTQTRLLKGDSAVYPKLEPFMRDETPRVAMPIPTLVLPEANEPKETVAATEQETIKPTMTTNAAAMPFAEKKTAIYNEKKYQDSLLHVYTNTRTVEVLKDDYKTVTRVIINKDNHVDIYAKVAHKWGATFYFIENGPQQYENISESFYKVVTNDETTPAVVAPADSVKH